MHGLRCLILAAGLLALPGCTPLALSLVGTGAGVLAGAGLDYARESIVTRTFSASAQIIREAALRTLRRMAIPVVASAAEPEREGVWRIVGEAKSRRIEIEIEALTPAATRTQVVASQGAFVKDRATATEIIVQIGAALDAADAASDGTG